jgi:hypothetical protein
VNNTTAIEPVIGGLSHNNESERIETQIMPDSPNNMTAERAEALLKSIIRACVAELMGCGNIQPEQTCEIVSAEYPDLCDVLGANRLLKLCHEVQQSEEPRLAADCDVHFYRFNQQFFAGRLEAYRIRLVYNLRCWVDEPHNHLRRSHIDLAGRQIFLPVTVGECDAMLCMLIHNMAHAATNTTTDEDNVWLLEMNRLRGLGAPMLENNVVDLL